MRNVHRCVLSSFWSRYLSMCARVSFNKFVFRSSKQRQELCRRYLYQQSTMSAEELEAARRAMVELRAEHNSPAGRAQAASPRRSCVQPSPVPSAL